MKYVCIYPTRRPVLELILKNKKKREKKGTCRLVDSVVPADHRVKIKENKKIDKHLDLA